MRHHEQDLQGQASRQAHQERSAPSAAPVSVAVNSSRIRSAPQQELIADAQHEILAHYEFSANDFTMDPTAEDLDVNQREQLETEFETVEDRDNEMLAEIMQNIDLRAPPPPEAKHDSPYYPYDSKTMFLLDTLDNLPRLRLSNSLMRVFIWILRELGAENVPSFDHLRDVQKRLRAKCAVPTIPGRSDLGNVFYLNDPRTLIAKDWATPEIRKHIHVYPEIPEDGIIRKIWHAKKWRNDMDPDLLSPMYDSGGKHFYGFANVPNAKTILISALDLSENYLDLQHENVLPHWPTTVPNCDSVNYPAKMPNPKRALADGDPLYTSFIEYFSDDVSGNWSKMWNKHWNVYMSHRNLPRQLLQQEFHVHFVSSSPHASVAEQYADFKKIIESTQHEPVKVRDGMTGDMTRFMLQNMIDPSDNPMQSEIAANIGAKGNFPCRKCEVGGTQAEKQQDELYHSLFEAGIPRTKEKIVIEIKKQLHLACSGVAQHVKDSQSATGVKDAYTQHWIQDLIARFHAMKDDPKNSRSNDEIKAELVQWVLDNREKIYSGFLTTNGFDPTKDTPVEILHTILGIVKYIWHSTHTSFSATQKYAGSLIGQQFKMLAQANIFHVRGLVSDTQFAIWRAVGELLALLWVPEIRKPDEYLADIKVAVANVLDAFAVLDPSKMLTKIKLHLLTHLPKDIPSFGPLFFASV
ncbi:hypothetical protein CPB85DRAFT_1249826 [Mucidula mucida]|nr:hypothetical protein CPB85DRAFT_1249826 [Mucidula mucida]